MYEGLLVRIGVPDGSAVVEFCIRDDLDGRKRIPLFITTNGHLAPSLIGANPAVASRSSVSAGAPTADLRHQNATEIKKPQIIVAHLYHREMLLLLSSTANYWVV